VHSRGTTDTKNKQSVTCSVVSVISTGIASLYLATESGTCW